MVYGRILYNNIREYTPKSFPTIPYSQTVKPVFGTLCFIQEDNLKSLASGMPTPWSKEDGGSWDNSSTQVGCTRSSCSASALVYGLLSSTLVYGPIRPIMLIAPMKPVWWKNEHTRRFFELVNRPKRLRRKLLRLLRLLLQVQLKMKNDWSNQIPLIQ